MDASMLLGFLALGRRRSALAPGCGCLIGACAVAFAFVATLALLCVVPSMLSTVVP